MKFSKFPLIIVASLIALSCSPTKPKDATPSALSATSPVFSVAPSFLNVAPPVLKIFGKENPDVYLQSLDIQVEVTGNIASTRYTMVFKNKTNRILEGELTFPLPDGRTVTYYALDINGKMREAVPVEKAKATEVFEEIEQRQVDPGLLEKVEGNNFRTRIYPIPAGGIRTISIGYEEELQLENNLLHYRLPMAYPDTLEKFAVKATVWKSIQKPLVPESEEELRFDAAGENYVAFFARENYKPSRALLFALPAPADIPRVMMQPAQGSYYFLTSVAPKMETRKKQWDGNLAIIWDVSLSGSQRNLQREIEMLDIIFSEKKNTKATLYFLNNTFKKIAGGNWKELKSILEMAVYDGGTDFSKINLKEIEGNEILFFSDGISTLSEADFLKNTNSNRPIHSIVSSVKSDYSAMRLIAGKTKGKFVNINALSNEELKNELLNETLQFLGIEHGDSVREAYPSIATPVYGNFSVAGISETNDAELTLLFGFGNKVEKKIKVKLEAKNASEQGNVYRIWAQKKIAELDLNYEKNHSELMELGKQFSIVTRNTSLIVLETVEDYIRYNIEPPAELQAEYLRRLKEREGRVSNDGKSNMLSMALSSAENLKKWWNIDFKPIKPKYPTPDNVEKRLSVVSSSSSATSTTKTANTIRATSSSSSATNAICGMTNIVKPKRGDINIKEARDGAGKTICTAGFNDELTVIQISGSNTLVTGPCQGWVYTSDVESVCAQRGMRIESVDVVGWMDNPSAVFVLDQYASEESRRFADSVMGLALGTKSSQPTITIKPIKKDNEYLKKLTGKMTEDYLIYLSLRNDYANSPTFYFDMADWFYTHNDRETALRILTSIADLELENASLYRLLGYRFKEYGEYALEKFVCQKVIQWRPMEPQSYRDYALALADNGEMQAALDSLYSLLLKPYSERNQKIAEVVFVEINHLIAKNPNLNISKIDKGLIINIPVDIRVVINWNMNNTDIDLHVKDPNGEECYFKNKETKSGGRISADIIGGYGPEQFLLKKAIKGKYQIYVNYYGDRQFTEAGPSTVMAEIFTKYSDKTEQRKVVSLQMSKAEKNDGKVEVAEFEF